MFPFAGVIDKEDIPCGPEIEDWLSIEPTTIFLANLCLTQNNIYVEQLFAEDNRDVDYLWVGLWNDRLYLYNGHHRAVKSALRGELAVQARVYKFD